MRPANTSNLPQACGAHSYLMKFFRTKKFFVGLLAITAWAYALFSYVLVDTNLVLSSNPVYWNFQQWLWRVFLPKSELLALVFGVLTFLLFVSYFGLLLSLRQKPFSKKELLGVLVLLVIPFFLAHNALSHDIFNYIFNAKMVVKYHANPHTTFPGSFSDDLWTRFMHNTHGYSPYGYVWTAVGVLPYLVGFGKFLPTFVSFKLLTLVSYLLFIVFSKKIIKLNRLKNPQLRLAMFAFNPLILVESLGNAHNDILMMLLALISYFYLVLFVRAQENKKAVRFLIFSLVFLLLSVGIKFVTIGLLPLFALVIIWKQRDFFDVSTKKLVEDYFPILASIVLFLPLFLKRSEQFYPWYLLWSLVWLPLIKNRHLQIGLLAFSFSSMFRYIPWMRASFNYGAEVVRVQKIISWFGGGLSVVVFYILDKVLLKNSDEK